MTSISVSYGKNPMKLVEVCKMIMTEKIKSMKLSTFSSRSTLNMDK